MKTRILLIPFILLVAAGSVTGIQERADSNAALQQTANQQSPSAKDDTRSRKDDDVVRISVTLVQIDAVVTDQQGKQVTDLKPEDFEIFEDNRRQQITNFSYVSTRTVPPPPSPKGEPRIVPRPGPPARLRPDQVRRTIALVVDDLGMSFESIASVQDSLKKFVDEQMQPGDLVAILRTGAGVGALQQFTADKAQLYAAIKRVRFNLMGGGGIGAFAPLRGGSPGDIGLGAAEFKAFQESSAATRVSNFQVGTLGALNVIVRGLRELPGRKSVILVSDGLRLFNSNSAPGVIDAVRRLIDLANRSSVVVYTIDPRGLQYTGLTPADNTAFMSRSEINRVGTARRELLSETQGGLNYLAIQTGGFLVRDNSVADGISRVLDDQRGYYLIGYVPEESSFKPVRGQRQFHKISVRAKRRDLRVRSRSGFIGASDDDLAPAGGTATKQLVTALTSPFSSGDIHLKLTSLFGHEEKPGTFMRSIMHIDARDVSFSEEPDGSRKGTIEIVAFTFGDNGQIVGREAQSYNLSVRGDGFQKLLDQGFVYALNVPIEKPGGYQLRVAVRDPRAERVGSASQFIDVPDVGANRLTLSGLVVSGYDPATARKSPAATGDRANINEGAVEEIDPKSTPAVRMLKRGTYLDYGFLIYNAQLDSKSKKPQLETQLILLRDGKQVFATKMSPLALGEEPDWKHIPASGRLRLGGELSPGDYILQIIVNDKLAKEKYRWGTQWMDFEIVN